MNYFKKYNRKEIQNNFEIIISNIIEVINTKFGIGFVINNFLIKQKKLNNSKITFWHLAH